MVWNVFLLKSSVFFIFSISSDVSTSRYLMFTCRIIHIWNIGTIMAFIVQFIMIDCWSFQCQTKIFINMIMFRVVVVVVVIVLMMMMMMMTGKLPESNSVGGKKQFLSSPLLPSHLGSGNICLNTIWRFSYMLKRGGVKRNGDTGCSICSKQPTHSVSQVFLTSCFYMYENERENISYHYLGKLIPNHFQLFPIEQYTCGLMCR